MYDADCTPNSYSAIHGSGTYPNMTEYTHNDIYGLVLF